MVKTSVAVVLLLAWLASPAAAQDAKTVISTASKAMGADTPENDRVFGHRL